MLHMVVNKENHNLNPYIWKPPLLLAAEMHLRLQFSLPIGDHLITGHQKSGSFPL